MRLKNLSSPLVLLITLGILATVYYIKEDKPAPTTKGNNTAKDFSIPAATPIPRVEYPLEMRNQKRSALVIGNSAYENLDLALTNPVNDAGDLAKVLRQLNFEVIEKTDLGKLEMELAIDQFSQKLDDNKGIGLFYFSGHGIQHNGVNYMLPVDVASLSAIWQLPHKTVSANYMLDGMKAAMNQVNIFILDACRDLPVSVKSWGKGDMVSGLSMEVPIPGSVIAYAAAPGGVAASGVGERNSPYVKHLMKWIQAPNLSVDEVFTKVGEAVKRETYGNQLPGYYKQLYKPFYFKWQDVAVAAVVPEESPSTSKVAQLLGVCETHFQAGRLSGGSASAWGCYEAVLKKEPMNAQALAGLTKIEKRYVVLIRGALKKKQVDSAVHYLASLRRVSPGSAQLAGLEASLSALRASLTVVTPPQPVVVTPPQPQPSPRDTFVAGKVFFDRLQDGSKGPSMVWISGGRFKMGDIQGGGYSDEQPVHDVSVGRFAMGRFEVTVGEYLRFVRATGRHAPEWQESGSKYNIETGTDSYYKKFGSALTNENHPIVGVSWYDAVAYAEWLSQQTGHKYRLPTEVEWEYAARAGSSTKYWWGNSIGSNKANCDSDCGDSFKYTAPVSSFAPNAFKLYDTVGNVWEWTCSEYENRYNGKETACKKHALIENAGANKSLFVLRGGSWNSVDWRTRTANRSRWQPAGRDGHFGFRLARIP
jgi:formylglycine-generating enzyme required for sulfatase activity